MKFPTLLIALGLGAAMAGAQEAPPPKKDTPATPTEPKDVQPPAPKPTEAKPKASPNRPSPNRFFEEQFRRQRAEIEELKNIYNLQIRKTAALEAEMKGMRAANETFRRELALKFASAKDITDLAEKIRELDKNRCNDLKVTNQQIDAILKIVTKLATAPPAPPANPRGGHDNPPVPAKFKFREHTVQAGEFLSTILEAYNKAFKDEGLKGRVTQSQVLKANPRLKVNRLLIGQKLRIPEPGEIK